MFGGVGIFHDGLMMAIIDEDRLYIRADDQNRTEFEAAGMAPFTYTAKGGKEARLSYYEIGGEALEDADEVLAWARKGVEAALRADEKKSASRKGCRRKK
ncbi:MAG: TfoX/Sxy family protein [bacterium]